MRLGKKHFSAVFAFVFAILATGTIYQFLQERESISIAAPQSATVGVVVARQNVAMGVKLTVEDLEVQAWPETSATGGYFQMAGSVVGKTTKSNLFAGEPITNSKLLREGENISSLIPEDMRAVTVPIRRSDILERMLVRGSLVDVIAIMGEDEPAKPKVIAQAVRVLSVSTPNPKDVNRTQGFMEVTLLAEPRKASWIVLATNEGVIEIVMRNDRPQKIS